MKTFRLFAVCIALMPGILLASDYEREQRWANQIVDAILDGEVVWLKLKEDKKFMGILTEAEDESNKGAIIMHGTGVHPDWQQVIYPLRTGLITHGWHTLSIQMPILASDADHTEYASVFDEVAPRIDAAIKSLKDKGINKIVLIGHSMGAVMAAYYLSGPHQPVAGFVGVGIGAFKNDPRMNALKSIAKIQQTPVLDLYGSQDLESILADTPARAEAAKKAGNQNYKQQSINGANHMFDNKNEQLIKTVADWLNTL